VTSKDRPSGISEEELDKKLARHDFFFGTGAIEKGNLRAAARRVSIIAGSGILEHERSHVLRIEQ
jgi:hypothetical protein